MKYFLLFIFALTAAAQPINYQGRLSDKSGTNVNGTKNFALRIFDAKTGGKQIYEENVGAVTVNEGAYSFNFGETGKSVVTPTETIAFADGEKQIFNYTAKNPPVLGEIKISGGGYSWTEAGSSDATKFTATANKNSGAVSAIYLTGAPEAGENVSISYDHNSNGVMGALSRGGQAWLEVSVGGEALSPRERLVAVPFALRALESVSAKKHPESLLFRESSKRNYVGYNAGHKVDIWNTHRRSKIYIPRYTKYVSVLCGIIEYKHKHNGRGSDPYKVEWRARINDVISKSIFRTGNYNEVSELKPDFQVYTKDYGYQELIVEYKDTDASSVPVHSQYQRLESEIKEDEWGVVFIHAHFD